MDNSSIQEMQWHMDKKSASAISTICKLGIILFVCMFLPMYKLTDLAETLVDLNNSFASIGLSQETEAKDWYSAFTYMWSHMADFAQWFYIGLILLVLVFAVGKIPIGTLLCSIVLFVWGCVGTCPKGYEVTFGYYALLILPVLIFIFSFVALTKRQTAKEEYIRLNNPNTDTNHLAVQPANLEMNMHVREKAMRLALLLQICSAAFVFVQLIPYLSIRAEYEGLSDKYRNLIGIWKDAYKAMSGIWYSYDSMIVWAILIVMAIFMVAIIFFAFMKLSIVVLILDSVYFGFSFWAGAVIKTYCGSHAYSYFMGYYLNMLLVIAIFVISILYLVKRSEGVREYKISKMTNQQ